MSSFITEHLEEILVEWESFARGLSPASATMDSLALRDHAKQMLEAIVKDIATHQSASEQALKSKGLGPVFFGVETAAASHGILRHAVGFDLRDLVAEFRALRATVLRLWVAKEKFGDAQTTYEMARFNEAIDQALAESVATYSEELARSRDTFLAILGHDLRSPLGALSGAIHVLSNSGDEKMRRDAERAGVQSVAGMSAMIRDLLEYTRTRLGKGIPITPEPGNLEAVVGAAIDEVLLAHPRLDIRYSANGNFDAVIDAPRMHQVVSNLLNNAIQHGKPGIPVKVSLRAGPRSLVLEVCNEGPTISPESLQVIFDPLVQVTDGDSARAAQGTNLGLGLFIAREIVVGHKGAIEVSSTAGVTTFKVTLPRGAVVSA